MREVQENIILALGQRRAESVADSLIKRDSRSRAYC